MPMWRTIPKAIQLIKEKDPETALTEYTLRRMVREGKLRTLESGRYTLVNLRDLGVKEEK